MKKGLLFILLSFAFYTFNFAQVAKVDDDSRTFSKQNPRIDLKVYPNPSYGNFFFIKGSEAIRKVELYNLVGRKMKTYYATSNKKYEVGDLEKGMYLVQFLDENDLVITTQRFTKR